MSFELAFVEQSQPNNYYGCNRNNHYRCTQRPEDLEIEIRIKKACWIIST